MNNLFLPYELALIAKQKGFNEDCFGGFNAYKELRFDYVGLVNNKQFSMPPQNHVAAPLYQQIIDWFRKKSIYFIESPHREENPAYFLFVPGITTENYGPFLLNKAIEDAFKLI